MEFPFKMRTVFNPILILLTLTLSIFLCSCGKAKAPKMVVGENFFVWESTAESTPGDAMQHMRDFKKLEDKTEHNLMHVFGKGQHYIWIRTEFEIPPQFKNQPLALIIPHLRFAEQVWCNGTFISQYGMFPPHEQSTLFKAHFFSFPIDILNQEGRNTVLLKVFIQGDSGISSHAFIQPTRFGYSSFEWINFFHARIYMLLFGIMLFTFVLYLCLYLSLRKLKEFREFAFLNLSTSFLLFYFFATEIPAYSTGQIPYLIFAKFTLCIPGYVIVYLSSLFAVDYYGTKTPKMLKIGRNLILAVQVLLTLFSSSYDFLIRISPVMMTLLFIQIAGIIYELVVHFIQKETRNRSIQFCLGFLPFFLGIALDITIRLLDNTQAYPYIMIFGWQGTIVAFIIMLSVRSSRMYRRNEQLTDHLQDEVYLRTHELQDANYELSLLNERLEKEKHRSEMDLEMASLVQRNFFPQPNKHFKGWEIAICYAPQAKVSGDLYDYYSYNDFLNGLSLFDVSGHGLSASLVTMLSKNIIARVFQTGFRRKESVDRILTKINNMIISEKGDIANYMTGLLCRFENIDDSNECKVELGNAGHPYPLQFSATDNEIYEIKGSEDKEHYGAIGMKGIDVAFASSEFTMNKDDILVCYTDGITEATNPKFDQFGTSEIKRIVKENHEKSSNELLSLVMKKLFEFVEEKPLDDDVTLIIAKRTDVDSFVSDDEHEEEISEQYEELEEAE